jgi:hypothetical protein
MATLSVADLRGLARLHRAGVDGAAEQIEDVIARRGEELPGLLGLPPSSLRRLREHADPVGALVATIEAAPTVAREARGRAQRETARRLAAAVEQSAVVRPGGNIEIDAALVGASCTEWPGGGAIVFGDRGGMEIRRLRALLSECRRLPISMLLTATSLNIKWKTARGHGQFKLRLWPVGDGADALVVRLSVLNTEDAPATPPGSSILGKGAQEGLNVVALTKADSRAIGHGLSCADAAPGSIDVATTAPDTRFPVVEAPRPRIVRPSPTRAVVARFIEALAAAMGSP